MGPTREGMRAVELVEVDEPREHDLCRAVDDDDGWGGSGDRRPVPLQRAEHRDGVLDEGTGRSSARRLRWTAAAAVAVALASGATALVDERREAARFAAVADLPGVLDPVEEPLLEVWRSDLRLWPPLWPVDGVLVGVSTVGIGSQDVVVAGLDDDTGETRWTTTVRPAGTTTPFGGVQCVVPSAPVGGGEADRVVVCVSVDVLGPDPQDLSVLEPRAARLLVLAPDTGEVLQERSVEPTASVAALGPDVVVQAVDDAGQLRVTRSDPRSGDGRWTFAPPTTTPPPRLGPVLTDDGLVVVPGEAGWVLDGEGDVVHAWEADRPAPAGWADVVRGRALVRPMRDLLGSTSVVDLDSGRSFLTDGYPLGPTADDGSTGDLVLVQSALGDGLVAHDLATGRPVWSVDGEDAGGVVVLGGRVVRAESDALRAVDARTGVTVWTAPSRAARQYGLHTDGRMVVRIERDDAVTTDVDLVARDLEDGRVRWRQPVPPDLEHLLEVEGRLVGLTRLGVVRFGPAGE